MACILGIETSCDETAVALVCDGRLAAQCMATQADIHTLFGGVVPELAAREHLRLLGPLLNMLRQQAEIDPACVDAVAVARGPGLLGSLLVGLSFAKGLCLAGGVPLIGVNHLWAHLLAPLLEQDIPWPALGLLVSGGHTRMYRIASALEFELLGRTLDDAAGEAFDKAAKTLNLPYPGGQLIDALGKQAEPDTSLFPRPYIDNQNTDFSFSGIKTALLHAVDRRPWLRFDQMVSSMEEIRSAMPDRAHYEELCMVCASYNWSIAQTLRIKMERALKRAGPVHSVIVAGGAAANSVIRRTMAEFATGHGLTLCIPSPALCTDNAAMIACMGELLFTAGWCHSTGLEAIPRGRSIPWDYTRIA